MHPQRAIHFARKVRSARECHSISSHAYQRCTGLHVICKSCCVRRWAPVCSTLSQIVFYDICSTPERPQQKLSLKQVPYPLDSDVKGWCKHVRWKPDRWRLRGTCVCAEVKVHPLLVTGGAVVGRRASAAGAAGEAVRHGVGHKDTGVAREAALPRVLLQVGRKRMGQRLQRLHMPASHRNKCHSVNLHASASTFHCACSEWVSLRCMKSECDWHCFPQQQSINEMEELQKWIHLEQGLGVLS